MKLITINHHKVHVTVMTLTRSLGQRSRSVSDGHGNIVNAIAPEPPREFEPKLIPAEASSSNSIYCSCKQTAKKKQKSKEKKISTKNAPCHLLVDNFFKNVKKEYYPLLRQHRSTLFLKTERVLEAFDISLGCILAHRAQSAIE